MWLVALSALVFPYGASAFQLAKGSHLLGLATSAIHPSSAAATTTLETNVAYVLQGGRTWLDVMGRTTGYLGLGRLIGPGVLIILAYWSFGARNAFRKGAAIVLAATLALALLVVGARAPLLATALAAFVPALVGLRLAAARLTLQRTAAAWWVLLILCGIVLGLLISTGNVPLTITRLSVLIDTDSGGWRRLEMYQAALSMWAERPLLGYGIGAWPLVTRAMDVRSYPHNLILEILAELGLVGLLLFGGLSLWALRGLGSAYTVRHDVLRLVILMLFVNAFLNSMSTGDLSDNRLVFGMLAVMSFPKSSRTSSTEPAVASQETQPRQTWPR